MKCQNCVALCIEGYEYPEEYCAAGVPDDRLVDFADGSTGCRLSAKTISARMKKAEKALSEEYQDVSEWYRECWYRDNKGIDIRSESEPFIDRAKHCVGMDYHDPYRRHGRRFYKPYRNFFACGDSNDYVWSILKDIGYAAERKPGYFKLTPSGLRWLGNCLNVKIYEEEHLHGGEATIFGVPLKEAERILTMHRVEGLDAAKAFEDGFNAGVEMVRGELMRHDMPGAESITISMKPHGGEEEE